MNKLRGCREGGERFITSTTRCMAAPLPTLLFIIFARTFEKDTGVLPTLLTHHHLTLKGKGGTTSDCILQYGVTLSEGLAQIPYFHLTEAPKVVEKLQSWGRIGVRQTDGMRHGSGGDCGRETDSVQGVRWCKQGLCEFRCAAAAGDVVVTLTRTLCGLCGKGLRHKFARSF